MDALEDLWGEEADENDTLAASAVSHSNDPFVAQPDWVKQQNDPADEDPDGDDHAWEEDGKDAAPAQHLVLLIDCAPAMMEPMVTELDLTQSARDIGEHHPGCTALDWGLRAFQDLYRELMRTAVIRRTGKRNGVGALLYHTRPRRPWVPDPQKVTNDDDDEEDDHRLGFSTVRIETVHEFVPLEVPNTPMLQRILWTLPDHRTQERRINIPAEFGQENERRESDHTYESHLQLPIYRALEEAKKVLDTAKCVRNKPTKVKGSLIMPPDAKQIWIITNQDQDPCQGNAEMLARIKERVDELREAGVDIYVWQLPTADMILVNQPFLHGRLEGKEMDHKALSYQLVENPFFASVGMIRPEQSRQEPLDRELFTRLAFRLNFKLQPSFSVPLLLPDWKQNPDYPGIHVDFYKIVKRASKPTAMRFHNETGQLLTRVTRMMTENQLIDVGEMVAGKGYRQILPEDKIKLFASLRGGKENPLQVEMRPTDLAIMKKACNANPDFASLILIGFKPREQISYFESIGECYFMYPKEDHVEGSHQAFVELYRGMQRKRVLAIGELLTRVSATSRCVAFWPMEDRSGLELPPQEGMVMVQLPFEDEIRTMPEHKDLSVMLFKEGGNDDNSEQVDLRSSDTVLSSAKSLVPEELVASLCTLCRKQSLDDRLIGEDFANAYLMEFYNYLEAMALGMEWQPTSDYDTVLSEEHRRVIVEAVGKEVEIVKSFLPEDNQPQRLAGKRKSTAEVNPMLDDTGIDWEQEYDGDRISKITVPNLKKYCEAYGLKRTGNKGDLVQRVSEDIAGRRRAPAEVKKEPEL